MQNLPPINLRWLKDFIAVAEFGSFSKAADMRAITQPAMSRHIRSLEDWVGVKLIDRGTFPAQLTEAGKHFYELANSTVKDLETGIEDIRQIFLTQTRQLRFSMQHAFAAEFFSQWWGPLQQQITDEDLTIKVDALNLHDCVQQLSSGLCDLMICYQHPDGKPVLEEESYSSIKIGADRIVPVSAVDTQGKPLFEISKPVNALLPLAGAAEEDFMGQLSRSIIARNNAAKWFQQVYEDSFSDGVRAQVLSGVGLAWLPHILVQNDLRQGRLKIIGDKKWQMELDIVLYRSNLNEGEFIQEIWQSAKSQN